MVIRITFIYGTRIIVVANGCVGQAVYGNLAIAVPQTDFSILAIPIAFTSPAVAMLRAHLAIRAE